MFKNKNSTRSQGHDAELLVCHYLQTQGLQLIEQNFSSRYGEIDLIMRDGQQLVFVEVRKRSSQNFGSAVATVNASKQKKIILTAQYYLQTKKVSSQQDCRFDVVGLKNTSASAQTKNLEDTHFDWVKNAFDGVSD